MLINSNYTVGQYFLASSIINSSFKKKKTKGLWYIVSLIISTVAFTLPIKSFFGTGLMQYFSVIFPIAILLTYNFLVFGKVTIWLKRP